MKKLIIAVAAVAMSVVANAAALNWSTWGYINDGTGDSDWIDGGQAYLVMVTDAANFAVGNDLSVTGGSIVDNKYVEGGTVNGVWNGTDSLVDGQTYNFAVIMTTDGTGSDVPTTGTYGVDDNGGALYSVAWNASTGGSFSADADTFEGFAMNTSVAPEPTSGLLLLLGMAGLALKRKRA